MLVVHVDVYRSTDLYPLRTTIQISLSSVAEIFTDVCSNVTLSDYSLFNFHQWFTRKPARTIRDGITQVTFFTVLTHLLNLIRTTTLWYLEHLKCILLTLIFWKKLTDSWCWKSMVPTSLECMWSSRSIWFKSFNCRDNVEFQQWIKQIR